MTAIHLYLTYINNVTELMITRTNDNYICAMQRIYCIKCNEISLFYCTNIITHRELPTKLQL